jgi:peptidoglycan LD-endopeptidase CwlK
MRRRLMGSRSIDDLHPALKPIAIAFLNDLKEQGIDVIVTDTYRSSDEQNALYAQGRTKPGKIVTDAQGGHSDHNFMLDGHPASKAFDIAPIKDGKLDYDDQPIWNRVEQVWRDFNAHLKGNYDLGWYGVNRKFKEKPHFYLDVRR